MSRDRLPPGNSRRSAPLDETVDRVAAAMQAIRSLHSQAQGDRSWVALGLSMAQWKALMVLMSTGGSTARGLASKLHIGPSAVTPLVDRLVALRLARREPDASDRRVVHVRPTPRAQALYERMWAAGRGVLRDMLHDLSGDELDQVRRGMVLLAEAAERRARALNEET